MSGHLDLARTSSSSLGSLSDRVKLHPTNRVKPYRPIPTFLWPDRHTNARTAGARVQSSTTERAHQISFSLSTCLLLPFAVVGCLAHSKFRSTERDRLCLFYRVSINHRAQIGVRVFKETDSATVCTIQSRRAATADLGFWSAFRPRYVFRSFIFGKLPLVLHFFKCMDVFRTKGVSTVFFAFWPFLGKFFTSMPF